MKRLLSVFLLACCLLLVGCGGTAAPAPGPSSVTLHVFAAASLQESFTAIGTRYQQLHPDIKLLFNFAGSQALEQQIANGAPADIFASADLANMQKASAAGLVSASQVFAQNRLVVIVPASNPAKITSLKDLAKKGVKIDIAAVTVPAGKYSRQVLDKMAGAPEYGPAYKSAVLSNIVSQEDNVKAVVQKVQLGEADAGFVYLTDVTAAVVSKVEVITIPDTFNVVAKYPLAVVKSASHATEATAFMQYVLSAEGQAILAKYHFIGKDG